MKPFLPRPVKRTRSDPLLLSIVPIGRIDSRFLSSLSSSLEDVFKGCRTELKDPWPIPADSYDPMRLQYYSTRLLKSLSMLKMNTYLDRVLGVTDVDLYAPSLNFVFGEAECPGDVALVSLFRLDPKFYDQKDDLLLSQRTLKEAVHELGHTFGLRHCGSLDCVMFFSNSIYDTDRKQERFCTSCWDKVNKNIGEG